MFLRHAVVEGGMRRSRSHEHLSSLGLQSHAENVDSASGVIRSQSHEQLNGLAAPTPSISCSTSPFDPLYLHSRAQRCNNALRGGVSIAGVSSLQVSAESPHKKAVGHLLVEMAALPVRLEESLVHSPSLTRRASFAWIERFPSDATLTFDPLVGLRQRRRLQSTLELDSETTQSSPIGSNAAEQTQAEMVAESQDRQFNSEGNQEAPAGASVGRRLERRRSASLLVLNLLAAMHGTNAVANRVVEQVVSPLLVPPSLTAAVRGLAGVTVFAPALRRAIERRDPSLIWAGMELGTWLFLGGLAQALGTNTDAGSNASLLFMFTLIFVPSMELCAGKSVSKVTWMATIAALSGMGLLEEEGLGWHGVALPHVGDLWTLAAAVFSAIHIFRSEARSSGHNLLELNAVQMATLAGLGIGWEVFDFLTIGHADIQLLLRQLESLPWGPLLYSGLICGGLASWLELKGLRDIHASTATLIYTTIPVWGAFFSFLRFGQLPGSSVGVGAVFILMASFLAQVTKPGKQEEELQTEQQKKSGEDTSVASTSSTGNQSQLTSHGTSTADEKDGEQQKKGDGTNPEGDILTGALLTSQLKFPYYAAQAQQLLAKAKVKTAAVKAALISLQASVMGSGAGHLGAVGNSTSLTSAVAGGPTVSTAAGVSANGFGVPDLAAASAAVVAEAAHTAEATGALLGAAANAAGGALGSMETLLGSAAESMAAATAEALGDGALHATSEMVTKTCVAVSENLASSSGIVHPAVTSVLVQSAPQVAKVLPPLGDLVQAMGALDVNQVLQELLSVHIQL